MTVKSLGYPTPIVSVAWDAISSKPATFAPAPHTHAWGDVTGKPTAFPPSAHTHPISDVTGLQAALDAKASTGSVTWSTLTGKPSTFPPSTHTHLWADITDRPTVPTLSTITPLAPAPTGVIGSSSMAARADHQHPLQAGRVELIGSITVNDTALISLALGMKRMAVTLSGVVANEGLTFSPAGVPTAGVEAVNVYASANNQVTVSYFTPALGIGTSYSIPLKVYRFVA